MRNISENYSNRQRLKGDVAQLNTEMIPIRVYLPAFCGQVRPVLL